MSAQQGCPARATGTVRFIDWLVLQKWPERRWRWLPFLVLRLYAVVLLVVAVYALLYQWTHGGFVGRPWP